jgi:hypothetical protein
MNNLRNLRSAFSGYANDGWPQIPKGIALGSNEEQRWWLEFTKKDLGLPEKTWRCPTITRLFRSSPEADRPLIHYLPTPFSAQPGKANKNAQMPWFIEIGNAHGSCFNEEGSSGYLLIDVESSTIHGTHIQNAFQDGTYSEDEEVSQYFIR